MTNSLRLEFDGTANTGLTAADSNINAKYTSDSPLVIGATQARDAEPTTEEKNEWATGESSSEEDLDRWLSRSAQGKKESDTPTGNLTGEDQYLGTYYNWYTATAGTGTYDLAAYSLASDDICPANWELPRYTSSRNAYTTLLRYVYDLITVSGDQTVVDGGNPDAIAIFRELPLSLAAGGYVSRNNGVTSGLGVWSYLFTGRKGDTGRYNAWSVLVFDFGRTTVNVSVNGASTNGRSIRCVAKR